MTLKVESMSPLQSSTTSTPTTPTTSKTKSNNILEEILSNYPKEVKIELEDQKIIDSVLAEELNKLTVNERELIFEEIHGVEPIIQETTELVTTCLERMQEEVDHIPSKPAYEMAEKMSKEYVTNPKFRLMFLRSESFDSKKAAQRMVNFFQGKLRLFGRDTLVRPLRLTDLNDGDLAALSSGCFQWLPRRDRSGRAILVDLFKMVPKSWDQEINLIRASVYMVHSAMEDEETQRRGVVAIQYNVGSTLGIDYEYSKEGEEIMGFLPCKQACIHMCFNNPWLNVYGCILLAAGGPSYRARMRLHSGSHTEVQYKLMTFGIPMELFPISTEGEFKSTNIEKWIERRRLRDRQLFPQQQHQERAQHQIDEEFSFIDMPGKYDVLVGKGKPFQRHVGNIRLRSLVESHIDDYAIARKGGKAELVRKVFQLVKDEGGRFLKKDTKDFWTPVSEIDALEKISKLFSSVKSSSKESKQLEAAMRQQRGSKKTMTTTSDVAEKKARITFSVCRSDGNPDMVYTGM